MKKSLLFLLLAMTLIFTACSNTSDDQNMEGDDAAQPPGEIEEGSSNDEDNGTGQDTDLNGEVAAIVNGQAITMETLEKRTQLNAINSLGADLSELDEEQQQLLYSTTLDHLIETEVLLQDSEEYKLSEEEIQAEFDSIIGQQGEDEFTEFLETYNMTEEDVKQNLAESYQIEDYFMAKYDEVTLDEGEIEAEYEAYKEEMEAAGREVSPLEDVRASIEEVGKRKKIIDSLMSSSTIEIHYESGI
ncbi:SurA N-terminal domain-containing protein [Bacillus horti]|uniref:Peptidylprolyl isomerase n=1 Tax=Caldalkalibacillus horti TaxID=77523 RepID=A0ABT9W0B9_9BACI|nr:SurA N-terminal domain-containing protein [Bacillus horti]MDQ0166549.1 hypothetical protein [Bacillus horti]